MFSSHLRIASLATALALMVAPAAAQASDPPSTQTAANPASMPNDLAADLNAGAPPAVVPFDDLAQAAGAHRLRAAIVDPATLWVAAVDSAGHVVAAQAPPLRYGTTWDPQRPSPKAAVASRVPSLFTLTDALRASSATILAYPAGAHAAGAGRLPFVFALVPMLLIGAVMTSLLLMRRRKLRAANPSMGGDFTPTGSSPAGAKKGQAVPDAAPPETRFTDVAGCDEVVDELAELVLFLRESERFAAVGAKMPRGVILHGPPGTGKTLIARAVAGEAGVPFYAVAGSDFVEKYVGVGASRVRELFKKATAHPEGAVVFIDEIDAVGRHRGNAQGGNEERESTLNQLLVAMDGFDQNAKVVVVAATNRLDMLDEALLRPGRFDRHVRVDPPNERGRLAILTLHASNKPLADGASLVRLAKITAGSSGATLQLMLNEAAIMAAREGRTVITSEDIAEGQLRAIAGPQKADAPFTAEERVRIAWHEAGHALAAELCPTHACTQRVTILARGQAGGLALYGREDRALMSPQDLHERCVVALAGRAAEELHFGGVSSGAANDLEMVNAMIRQAVVELGFSSAVGQLVAPARAGGTQMLAESTREQIDVEVRRLIDQAYADAIALLKTHKRELDTFAGELLEREQLEREDIERLVASFKPRRRPSTAAAKLAAEPQRKPRPVTVLHPVPAPEPDREGKVARLRRRVRKATEPWLTPDTPQLAASSTDDEA
jgi:cell division protease FtsH